MHRCVGYAQLSSKSGHGACNGVGINSGVGSDFAWKYEGRLAFSYGISKDMAPRRIEWVDQVFLGGRFSA